eukprot:jgi/Galph1/5719/GphlegSOOS_G4411.1
MTSLATLKNEKNNMFLHTDVAVDIKETHPLLPPCCSVPNQFLSKASSYRYRGTYLMLCIYCGFLMYQNKENKQHGAYIVPVRVEFTPDDWTFIPLGIHKFYPTKVNSLIGSVIFYFLFTGLFYISCYFCEFYQQLPIDARYFGSHERHVDVLSRQLHGNRKLSNHPYRKDRTCE